MESTGFFYFTPEIGGWLWDPAGSSEGPGSGEKPPRAKNRSNRRITRNPAATVQRKEPSSTKASIESLPHLYHTALIVWVGLAFRLGH